MYTNTSICQKTSNINTLRIRRLRHSLLNSISLLNAAWDIKYIQEVKSSPTFRVLLCVECSFTAKVYKILKDSGAIPCWISTSDDLQKVSKRRQAISYIVNIFTISRYRRNRVCVSTSFCAHGC